MFTDCPDRRQRITMSLRTEISKMRVQKGYSANYFAKNILQKSQSWFAQIESGKIKTISNSDLVDMFAKLLDTSEEEVEKYLTDNYDRLFSNNIPEINEAPFNEQNAKKIAVYKANPIESKDEIKNLYKGYVQNLDEGLMIFFDNVDSQDDALKILRNFVRNMHQDMGFTLSVAALPLGSLRNIESGEKEAAFKEILQVIKKHGDFKLTNTDTNTDKSIDTEKK